MNNGFRSGEVLGYSIQCILTEFSYSSAAGLVCSSQNKKKVLFPKELASQLIRSGEDMGCLLP